MVGERPPLRMLRILLDAYQRCGVPLTHCDTRAVLVGVGRTGSGRHWPHLDVREPPNPPVHKG
jgi:hypothetical protein